MTARDVRDDCCVTHLCTLSLSHICRTLLLFTTTTHTHCHVTFSTLRLVPTTTHRNNIQNPPALFPPNTHTLSCHSQRPPAGFHTHTHTHTLKHTHTHTHHGGE